VKLSPTSNDNLIDRTREIWQPRLGHNLSREDARQIVENVTGCFNILTEWSRADIRTGNENGHGVKAANQSKTANATESTEVAP
jgi:hypothetical protein